MHFSTTDGVEQSELRRPWEAIKNAGAEVELLLIHAGEIQGLQHMDKGEKFKVNRVVDEADSSRYDGLV